MTKEERDKKLAEFKAGIKKEYGAGAIIVGNENMPKIDSISTGSIDLDEKLSVGGYPRGRIIEIFGPESSGKSTLAMHGMAECQKGGEVAAYIDLECSFDPIYAQAIGVNVDELHIVQPTTSEEGLNIMLKMLESGCYGFVVLDSVAAILPASEDEDEIGAQKMGLVARLMSQTLRKIVPAAYKSNAVMMFINQTREKIGGYGNPVTTPGGKALGFAASVRLQISSSANKAPDGTILSNHAKVKIIKSKVGRPFLTSEFDIAYGIGIDKMQEILDKAIEKGIINKGGSWLTYGETKVQGTEKFKQLMLDNEELTNEIKDKICGKEQ